MDILKALGFNRPKPEEKPVTVGYHGPANRGMGNLVMPWVRWDSRKKLEEDLVFMDKNSPIVARMLDRTADYATIFDEDEGLPLGFKIQTAEGDGEQPTAIQKKGVAVVNEMVERVNLTGQSCWDTMRGMVGKGNVFTEVVLDKDTEHIAAVRQFRNSWQIEKNLDNSGNLKAGDPVEAVRDPKKSHEAAYIQIDEIGKVIAAFWPYQMNHWTFGPLGGNIYAEPVGAAGIKAFKRLDAGMDSLGVARVVRAWDTNVHIIPIPAGLSGDEVAEKIQEYQYSMEQDETTTYDSSSGNFQSTPKYSPFDVSRDIYVPEFYTTDGKVVAGDIKKLLPSTAALQHLEDLELGINLLVCTFGVPIEILGLDIGKKPMVDKTAPLGMEAFSKYLRRLQFNHATGLKALFDLELLLNGINPMQPLYKIMYPGISPQTAEANAKILLTKGQTALYYSKMMVPEELIGKKALDFDANDVAVWKANVQKKETEAKAAQAAQAKAIGVEPKKAPADPGKPTKPSTKDP